MNREFKNFYNTVIVGGGINGAGLLRDLALHEVDTLLIDANDFCSQTSASSSKMLHGGIRYLETLDFSLVHEALHEKNIWLKLAPEHCYETAFHLPNYKYMKYPLWALGAGLKLYDTLSLFENSPSYLLNRSKTLEIIPELNPLQLNGCGVYYDAVMDDIKIGLNCIWDAIRLNNCQAENYVELISFDKGTEFFQLKIYDHILDAFQIIKCKHLVFATGPFTDKLMHKLNVRHWENKLLPNKGIHLLLKKDKLPIKNPIVIQNKDNRVIFVIPHLDHILVGTTETKLEEVKFNLDAESTEINYLLNLLNSYFPNKNFNELDIISTFAGIRPLVKAEGQNDISKTSRKHLVVRPYENCFTILGGKYTTFRVMVQEISKQIVQNNFKSYDENKTLTPFATHLVHQNFKPYEITTETIEQIIKYEKIFFKDDLIKRRLSKYSRDELSMSENQLIDLKLKSIRDCHITTRP